MAIGNHEMNPTAAFIASLCCGWRLTSMRQVALPDAMQGTTTDSADAFFCDEQDVQSRYEAIAQDSRYGHYVRIPERICRCLDYFKISSGRSTVRKRLHSYYLFIGVVDDVIDSDQPETGREILEQLVERKPLLDDNTRESGARLVTEVFKSHISPETYPAILAKLEELYRAVVSERKCATMNAYIDQRKAIGCLTAEVSYLLIRPLLASEHEGLRCFLQKVGEVGCLMDSVIDLRADARLGLISFRPTLKDYLHLVSEMLRDGFRILLKHTRLLGLFMEATIDDLLDFRFRGLVDRSHDSTCLGAADAESTEFRQSPANC
jgi:hypothetical protein